MKWTISMKYLLAYWKRATILFQNRIKESFRIVVSVSWIPELIREEVRLVILFLLRVNDSLPVCCNRSGLRIRKELL